jgi:SH3-like domain-containing protein
VHRIDWEYRKRRGMPVEITAEADHWRRIRDIDGDEGWVHASQLSAVRGAMVKGPDAVALHRAPSADSAAVALVEPMLIGRIRRCRGEWCRLSFRNHTGWLNRDVLWGLYPDEEGID